MLDQVGEYVELADVPCIHGVGVELVHVKNVGRVRNVLQPVLHDTQHLVRTPEGRFHGGGVMVERLNSATGIMRSAVGGITNSFGSISSRWIAYAARS